VSRGQIGVVSRLGIAQTLSWASSYYLPALLAAPLAQDLRLPVNHVFGAFTLALVISAIVGPFSGRAIDQHGGRSVLMATNVLFAIGLSGLGLAQAEWQMWLAWAVIGLAMGSGLYDAAFSTLVRIYPVSARNAITGITLIAGFASTVGWPLTAWWIDALGWRSACMVWACLHLLLGVPLHWMLPKNPLEVPPVHPYLPDRAEQATVKNPSRWIALAMALVFAISWFISTAMAVHLPHMLRTHGLETSAALAVAMLVGPAQVAGRLLEFGLLRHVHPLLSARLAAGAHPIGVIALILTGSPAAWLFASLHGAGNGILTIAKGTLPLVFFGASGYGQRQGWLMLPARCAQAAAPVVFGMAMMHWGGSAMWLTAGLGIVALLLLQAMASRVQRDAHR
jgi:MFS family permease